MIQKKSKKIQPKVSIILGSKNDYSCMIESEKILKKLKIKFDTRIVSAHRTPKRMFEWAENAHLKGYTLIIAAAGGSASLPSVTAALASIPVIGVPIETKKLNGLDSLLSLNCCPSGCPLAMAKGQPEGQQFKLSRLSNPFNFFVSIGTPITGIDAKAAVTEGNEALPPAAAIINV